jgi:hypothetical protein
MAFPTRCYSLDAARLQSARQRGQLSFGVFHMALIYRATTLRTGRPQCQGMSTLEWQVGPGCEPEAPFGDCLSSAAEQDPLCEGHAVR